MNKTENINEKSTDYVEFIIYRIPRKNQEPMLQLNKKSLDFFSKEGVKYDNFKLGNTENIPGFTNITKTISAASDDEVWMDLLYYRDRKHRDEFASNMSNNKDSQEACQEFMKLTTPGSEIINGEFSRL